MTESKAVGRFIVSRRSCRDGLHRLPAIYDHRVAHYEGRRVRTQPEDGAGDLLGLAHAADGFLRDHPRTTFGRVTGEASDHCRVDDAGAHRVDADVEPRVVEGGALGHAEAGFRVGYDDASHFSRDYKLHFGEP